MYREEAITSRIAFPRSKYRTKGDLESMALEGTSGRGREDLGKEGPNRYMENGDSIGAFKIYK